ncbi:MAG: hypothetical protein ACYCPS_04850 [Candidatus Saccharimonadales bacterium]
MRWRPDPEHTAAWSAAGAALMVVGAGVAVPLALQPASARIPALPIYLAGGAGVIGFYVMLAPLLRLPPWRTRSPNAQVNRFIRRQFRALKRRRRRESSLPAKSADTQVSGTQTPQSRAAAAQPSVKSALEGITDETIRTLAGRTPATPARDEGVARVEKTPVSPEHRDMLKSVAAQLLSYLQASQKAFYGSKGDELKAQSFQEHFPEIRWRIEEWNARIDVRESARDQLRSWVASRLHALHYDRPPYSGGLDGPITAAALQDVPRLSFGEVLGCLHLGPYTVVVLPSMKELDPNWGEVPDVDRGRVEQELQEITTEAAGRPERQNARDAARSLPEVGDPLTRELTLIREKDVIRGLGDCELCR